MILTAFDSRGLSVPERPSINPVIHMRSRIFRFTAVGIGLPGATMLFTTTNTSAEIDAGNGVALAIAVE